MGLSEWVNVSVPLQEISWNFVSYAGATRKKIALLQFRTSKENGTIIDNFVGCLSRTVFYGVAESI